MSQSSHPPYDAGDALRDVDLARDAIITRGATPSWYHPVVGSGLGLLLLVVGLDTPLLVQAVTLAGFTALLGVAVRAYRRRSGMLFGHQQATRRGAARLAALAVALLVCVALVLGGREAGHAWMVWAGALLVPVLYPVLGRAYDRQLFRDLRAGRVEVPKQTGRGR